VAVKAATDSIRLPEIQVTGGRINFKFGNRKSAFYLTNADVTIAARASEKGAFLVRISGEPSRTDRAAQGFGEFSVAGRLLTGTGDSRLELDVELEKGDLADLVTLFRGHSVGLHGLIAANAKVYGPVSNLQILGTVNLDDLHRWDVAPQPTGGVVLKYRGSFNAATERVEMAALPDDNPGVPMSARLIVDNALSKPQWSADLSVDGMPASAFIEVARDMGAPIPAAVSVQGKVVGVVGYGPAAGVQGQLVIDGATVKLGSGPELTVSKAEVLIAGEELRLTPASVAGDGRSAELEASFVPTRDRFDAVIRGKSLPVSSLASGTFIATASNPFVSRLAGGTWSGWVRYSSDPDNEGYWDANLDIRNTATRIPGVAVPVKVADASVELNGTDVAIKRMRLAIGDIDIEGDYVYTTKGDIHAFNANIEEVSGQEIERVLAPTLRRNAGLLSRMRFTRSSGTEWLRQRSARGSVRIGALTLGDVLVQGFESRVEWSGTAIRFSGIRGQIEEGVLIADAALDLSKTEPEYRVDGSFTDMTWRGGQVDLIGTIATRGTGDALLLNLRSEGSFRARSVDVIPEFPLRTLTGTYGLSVTRSGPRLRLTALQAAMGTERFLGQGSTQADGRLQVELASANRIMQVSGPVAPLKLEVTTERSATAARN
jgi:hypothetical protein